MSLRDEILEQPDAARRLLAAGRDPIDAIAEAVRRRGVELVVIAARGSSDHAAIYAQYLFGAFQRLPVSLATPALTSIYGRTPRMAKALVIGISQSGRSPDVVGVVADARAQGAITVTITNAAGSPLAEAAEHVIDVQAGPELAVAATKSYTAQLLAIAMLATAIGGVDDPRFGADDAARDAALAALPELMGRALAGEEAIAAAARDRAAIDRCVILGRGFDYASAREWALKLKELAQVAADPYSSADFQHGPLALVEPGYPVLAFAATNATLPGVRELLGKLKTEHGVDLVVVSDDAETRKIANATLPLPAGIAEWLTPIVSILPAQLFAAHLTRARGLDLERPRFLSKVTLTR